MERKCYGLFVGILENSDNLFYEVQFVFFWQVAESAQRVYVVSSERAYTIKDIIGFSFWSILNRCLRLEKLYCMHIISHCPGQLPCEG